MTTRSPGGRPSDRVNAATSAATAVADLGGDRAAFQQPGGQLVGRRIEGVARLPVGHDLARRGGQALHLVEEVGDADHDGTFPVRVADRRQVDEDVRRGAAGRGLTEE